MNKILSNLNSPSGRSGTVEGKHYAFCMGGLEPSGLKRQEGVLAV